MSCARTAVPVRRAPARRVLPARRSRALSDRVAGISKKKTNSNTPSWSTYPRPTVRPTRSPNVAIPIRPKIRWTPSWKAWKNKCDHTLHFRSSSPRSPSQCLPTQSCSKSPSHKTRCSSLARMNRSTTILLSYVIVN